MSLWLAIPLGVGPCLVWLWLIHWHDDHEREPWSHLLLALAFGALSVCGVLWTRPMLEDWIDPATTLGTAFLVTALGEEAWKLVALLPLLCMAELDEPLDGAIYGAAAGLGFAGVENVFYSQWGGDAMLMLQRAFTSTLLHAACSGSLGFAYAMVKLHRVGRATPVWLIGGFALAVTVHGLYDHYLEGDRARAMVSLMGVLPAGLWLFTLKIRWARSRSPRYHPPD